jgi:hypothetical protein
MFYDHLTIRSTLGSVVLPPQAPITPKTEQSGLTIGASPSNVHESIGFYCLDLLRHASAGGRATEPPF